MRRLSSFLIPLALLVASCSSSDGESSGDTLAAPTSDTTTPVATDPPATDPPATDPPATDPPATDPPTTEPPATDPPLAEITPIGLGAFGVGVTTITITDESRDRPLTVDVWFPLADGTTGEPHRYTFITGDYYESPDAITAEPSSMAPEGPYPLVLYSHGSGGTRYQSSFYTEALASHGYIVAAPDHTGNTAVDRIAGSDTSRDQIALDRVLDIRTVLDEMLNPESPSTVGFVASINPDQIAVTGHSFGGFTTYAMVSGYDNALGSFDGDERIDAIIPLAPATGDGGPESLLSDERLASVDVPSLVMVGTNDQTTPLDPNVTRPWELTSSAPSYRLELIDAQHQTFTDICDYREFIPALENPTPVVVETIEALAVEGCSPGDMPIERAKDLINTFAISFLGSLFGGSDMITPTENEMPADIEFLVK